MLIFTFSTYFMTFAFLLANITILLTKTIAARTEDALSYYRVRGLYSPAVVFVTTTCLDDEILKEKKVLVSRLPSKHCELNPIGLNLLLH